MNILYFLAKLEMTSLSIWLRESGLAFFTSLTVHSLAMGFVVGINLAIALALLGYVPNFNSLKFNKFYSWHWTCCVLILISGLALLIAYPAKALSNPVFYLKLIALLCALSISYKIQQRFKQGDEGRKHPILALSSIGLWIITISAGRFLAYTHSILLASRFY